MKPVIFIVLAAAIIESVQCLYSSNGAVVQLTNGNFKKLVHNASKVPS